MERKNRGLKLHEPSQKEAQVSYINLTAQIRIRKWDASFTDGAPGSTRTSITYILGQI